MVDRRTALMVRFSLMAATVNVNGRISDQEHAVISVFDHGFLYGEGVYETWRTYNGQPFLFEDRLACLAVEDGQKGVVGLREVKAIAQQQRRRAGGVERRGARERGASLPARSSPPSQLWTPGPPASNDFAAREMWRSNASGDGGP